MVDGKKMEEEVVCFQSREWCSRLRRQSLARKWERRQSYSSPRFTRTKRFRGKKWNSSLDFLMRGENQAYARVEDEEE